jgi:hypothetical protein
VQQAAVRHIIPLAAVFERQGAGGNPRVWALMPDNTVHSVPVTLGRLVGANEVEVAGLSEGLKIVTAGASRLHESQAVSVLQSFAIGGSLASAKSDALSAAKDPSTSVLSVALPDLRRTP